MVDIRDMTMKQLAEICDQAVELVGEAGNQTALYLESTDGDDPKALQLAEAELEVEVMAGRLLAQAANVLRAADDLARMRQAHWRGGFDLVPALLDEGE